MARSLLRARLAALVYVVAILLPWLPLQAQASLSHPPAPRSAPTLQQAFPAEIATLAAGLGNDPLAIYDYVHNQIDYIPTWGLLKSPRETLLAGAGNPFDQAVLLAALLEAAGFAPQYVRGTIRLTDQQALNWTGAADRQAAIDILSTGGFVIAVEASALRVPHIWVRIDAGGPRDLDPSFKVYAEEAGADLRALLGLDMAGLISRAGQGATITANATRQLNLANLEADATSAATSLVSALRDDQPFLSAAELIGGRRIVPASSTSYPALPYEVVSSATAASLSDVDHTLRITIAGVDYTTTTDAIDGRRVTLFYECATPADCQALESGGGIFEVPDPASIDVVPRLRVGGELVASGAAVPLGTAQVLEISITTPAPGVETFRFPRYLIAGGWYALPMRLQGVSSRSLSRQIGLLNVALGQGLPLDDEQVLGQILHVLGLAYFHEVGLGDRIDSRLAGVALVPRFSVMVASRDLLLYGNAQGQLVDIDPGAHSVDVGLRIDNVVALASGPAAATSERAWFLSAGIRSSAIEHAIIEQLQPGPAVSAVQLLRQALASGDTLYYLTPANAAATLPLLDPEVAARVGPRVSENQFVVVPGAMVTYDQWVGTGWIEFDPDGGTGGYIISGGIGTTQGVVRRTISGGGGTRAANSALVGPNTTQFDQDQQAGPTAPDSLLVRVEDADNNPEVLKSRALRLQMSDPRNIIPLQKSDPINVISGAFIEQRADLAPLGGLGPALAFTRWYSSARHSLDGPLGFGWSHSYQQGFAFRTEWARSFGERTALEAAPALAAAQIGFDLLNEATIPQERFAMATAVSAWLLRQITDSAAVVSEPSGAVASYVRLIDGSYLGPDLSPRLSAVAAAGDGSATLTWADGRRSHFDSAGRLTASEDANGNRATLSYNAQGRLTQVRDAADRLLTLSYNAQGRLSQIADPAGRVFAYAYDAQGNLQTTTSPRGAATTYTYDSAHRITRITDPLGVAFVQNSYDALGRVATQVNGRGAQTTLRYGGDRTIITDALGARGTYSVDPQGRLVAVENPLGARRTLSYDAAGNLRSLSDGLGLTFTYGYDTLSRLTSSTDPLGQVRGWAYDSAGNLAGLSEPGGAQWQLAYDANRNLTSITDPTGIVTQLRYDPQGQLAAVEDAVGVTALTYDAAGNLACIQDALGHRRCWGYDSLGRPTSFTDGSGLTTQFQYDAHNNLTRLTAPGGGATRYTYDGNDALTGVIDANNHTTSYAYDAQFNLTSVTDALGGITRYQYDLGDRMTRLTDARGNATDYAYDVAGRLSGVTDPLGRESTLSYDAADRLTGWTRPDASQIQYGYDALGRLTAIDTAAGPDSSFSYDAAGRLVAAAQGDSWDVAYTYDAAGRLTSSEEAGRELTTRYGYDAVGRRASLVVERGATKLYDLAYSYDAADRLTAITDRLSDPDVALTLGYDAADRLTVVGSPSQAATSYSYSAGRLSQIQHKAAGGAVLATYAYSYDPVGNTLQATETSAATGTFITAYSYDALDRLVKEQYPRYAIDYSYDAVGNLTRRADALGAVSYTYDSADQLTARGAETFAYDLNGSLTSWQNGQLTTSYTYDGLSRLAGVARTDGMAASFSYDSFGRRIGIGGAAGASSFLFDGADLILGGGADLAQAPQRYLYADGMLLARNSAGGLNTYQGDSGEHVRTLLNAAGHPVDSYSYDAYGRPGLPAGLDPNPFRYVGQRSVYSHSALAWPDLQMGQRFYDPAGARFQTLDPLPRLLLRPQSPYSYASGNPLAFNDPGGLRSEPAQADTSSLDLGGSPRLRLLSNLLTGLAERMSRFVLSAPAFRSDRSSPVRRYDAAVRTARRLIDRIRRLSRTLPAVPETPPGIPPQPTIHDPPPGPLLGADPEASGWQHLTGQGGFYALACSARFELLAGSFHAGLSRSTTAEREDWPTVSHIGISALALGAGTAYAGGPRVGVLKSADTRAWISATTGLKANDVYAIATEPGATGKIFAGTEMGLFVSANQGSSWANSIPSVPGRVVSELAVVGDRLIAVTDQGLFSSTRSGGAWQRATGLPGAPIFALATLTETATLYAGTALGVYRSTDGGRTWAAHSAGLAGRAVYALAIDPATPQHIFAGTASGLFLSTNGGGTWTQDQRAGLSGDAIQIGALAFCPSGADKELYIGSGAGIYALQETRGPYPAPPPPPIYLPLLRR